MSDGSMAACMHSFGTECNCFTTSICGEHIDDFSELGHDHLLVEVQSKAALEHDGHGHAVDHSQA